MPTDEHGYYSKLKMQLVLQVLHLVNHLPSCVGTTEEGPRHESDQYDSATCPPLGRSLSSGHDSASLVTCPDVQGWQQSRTPLSRPPKGVAASPEDDQASDEVAKRGTWDEWRSSVVGVAAGRPRLPPACRWGRDPSTVVQASGSSPEEDDDC